MDTENIPPLNKQEEKSIDFGRIFRALKRNWRIYLIALIAAYVISYVYTRALPNEYKCAVKLMPESGGTGTSMGTMGSLASAFGFTVSNNNSGGAYAPRFYPELTSSLKFKTGMFNVVINAEKKIGGRANMTYYEYLANEQKHPWWHGLGFSSLFGKKEKPRVKAPEKVDIFRLTGQEAGIAGMIGLKVKCTIDKSGLILIEVKDQDPLVAATIADSVSVRLQDFLTEYRTDKARRDLEYFKKLCAESKQRYEKARRTYADFADANQNVILQSVRSRQTDLENEMQLQFNAYNSFAGQLLAAQAKVQEVTPAFSTLQPATVPLGPFGPKRNMIRNVVLALTFLVTTIGILVKEGELRSLI